MGSLEIGKRRWNTTEKPRRPPGTQWLEREMESRGKIKKLEAKAWEDKGYCVQGQISKKTGEKNIKEE